MKDQDSLRQALEGLGPHFELVREIGRGATAVVYLLRDHELDRDVAAKIIRSSFLHDEEARARLQREALLVARLQHPNIVKLFGTRHLEDGSTVLLMEHVPGRNLKEVLREEGPLPPGRAAVVLRDVTSALAYAHRRHIVHRDVKPENIYLDDEVGTARLADFGVARPWDQDSSLTLPGESLGTPAYMSPEQVDGGSIDGRSDVYSLGLVGYEMLTGEHPWEGDNLFTLIFKQKNEAPPPLEEVVPDVPPRLQQLLERALAKDPDERWESADAFLEELKELERSGGLGFSRNWVDGLFDSVERRGSPRPPAPMQPPSPPTTPTTPSGAAAGDAGPGERVGGGAAAGGGAAGLGAADAMARAGSDVQGGTHGEAGAETVGATESVDGAETALADAPGPERSPRSRVAWILGVAIAANVVLVLVLFWGGWFGGANGTESPGFEDAGSGVASAEAGAADGEGDGRAGAVDRAEAAEPGTSGSALLTALEGDGQEVQVGSTVPLEVRVSGPDGEPVPDQPVVFQVQGEGGVLEPTSTTTDAEGIARASFTVPSVPGPVRVVATTPDGAADTAVPLDLMATVGAPSRALAVEGQGQEGEAGSPLPRPLTVRVLDEAGNPVPYAEVVMQSDGTGSVEPSRARTDLSGQASFQWQLGSAAGGQQVVGRLPEAPGLQVVFQATARPAEDAEEQAARTDPEPEGATGAEAPSPPTDAPAPTVVRHTFAVGGTNVCRLGSQSVWCRGGGRVGGSASIGLRSVAAGVSHACGLSGEGVAFCWGSNGSGQLGDGTLTDRQEPAPVETETRFGTITAGLSHTCALDGAGRAHCWGRNVSGQLGDGSREDRTTPRPTSGGIRMQRLVAGWNHTCGLTGSGGVACWGLNDEGQLGDGTRVDRLAPSAVPSLGGQQYLTAGSAHTCALGGGTLRCWGDNTFGQVGDGTRQTRSEPVEVGLPQPASRVAAGAVHTCALLTDASVWCWGQNSHGQLGDGSTTDRETPVQVQGGHAFTAIHAGGGSTCGFTVEGDELCWGLNQSGQLGDGTRTNRSVPTPVGD